MPKAIPTIEGAMKRFEKVLTQSFNNRISFNSKNLTKTQENILHYLINSNEHIMLLANKNLGTCVMNRYDCIKQCIRQHLSDAKSYEKIRKEVAW